MSEIARWGDHYFRVENTWIRSLSSMEIKASCETDDKSSGGEKYVARKNSKPTEIKLTIPLDARLGIKNVKKEVKTFLEEAQAGKKGYFYAACKKLFTYQLMLVEAKCKNKDITRDGTWASADVELVLKQCTKIDGTLPRPKPSTSSGGSSGSSGDTGGNTGATGGSDHSAAEDKINQTHAAAHSASSGKGGGGGRTSGGGGGRMVAVAMLN